MTNAPTPSGPANPINPGRSSEPARPGTDKFKKLMKVGEPSEKQKKKKKRPEEIEEEKKAGLQTGPVSADKAASSAGKINQFPKIQKVSESEKRQTKHQKRREEEITTTAPSTSLGAPSSKEIAEHTAISKSKEKARESVQPPPQPPQKLDEIIEEEQQIVQQEKAFEKTKPTAPLKAETPTTLPPAASPLGPSFLPPPTEVAPAYSLLGGQTLALFEKMVSMIMVMQSSGMTETTIHLPEFANAQIVIREFSTAPLAYNIELIGNPEAVAFFQRNLAPLRTAFQERKLRFSVNRLETSLSKEEFPKIERKKESE
jgi:hypothetical protein